MSAVPAQLALEQNCGNCGHSSVRPASGFLRCSYLKDWNWLVASAPCSIGKWTPITLETKARRDAQEGIDRALATAEREIEGWGDLAYRFIRNYATVNKGKRVIGHEIIKASVSYGIVQPGNSKAWGGPLQRAARNGLILKVGTAADPNRHTNPVPLWEMVGEVAS